jgi:transcriptional regulator with XRE-family HTH domain
MIRERIVEAVRASGLSQREIARTTGINEGQLSRFNRGLRTMSLRSLDQLLERLNLEIIIVKTRKEN